MHSARNKGFTLVELLVVISIIAILSVIGIVVFTGIQKSSRDARRRADINAIANVLEANKNLASGEYQFPAETLFSSGKFPYDPIISGVDDWSQPGSTCGKKDSSSESRCWYCYRTSKTVGYCIASTDKSPHRLENFTSLNVKTSWVICANLESGSPAYYCKANSQ